MLPMVRKKLVRNSLASSKKFRYSDLNASYPKIQELFTNLISESLLHMRNNEEKQECQIKPKFPNLKTEKE